MKTVYFLGAGFSKPANGPMQSELICEILKLRDGTKFLRDDIVWQYVDKFEKFLSDDLFIDKSSYREIALEDILTPIDRCILDRVSFRSIDAEHLVELREKIYALISIAIRERLASGSKSKAYVDDFAKYLVAQTKSQVGKKFHDPVSVISTNWDILLDNSIKHVLDGDRNKAGRNNGVVDYCCYISSLKDDPTIIPGLLALGKEMYNVKLLKLHGSMNWLHCPYCQRMFVAFFEKYSAQEIFEKRSCNYCGSENGGNPKAAILRSNLIMPTFLKDLNNFQIKLIWQNAGVELMEANKVVFIGYSLPTSDYELRQLLSRMIPHQAKIEVVMAPEVTDNSRSDNDETFKRYKSFFGKREVNDYRMGVVEYINSI